MKTPTGEEGHNPSSAVVGTDVKEILPLNAKRLWTAVTNVTNNTCYIGLTEGVNATNGFPVSRNDAFVIDRDNPYSGKIYAITETGTADLRIIEVSKA